MIDREPREPCSRSGRGRAPEPGPGASSLTIASGSEGRALSQPQEPREVEQKGPVSEGGHQASLEDDGHLEKSSK